LKRSIDARLAVPAATAWAGAAVVQTWSPRHSAALAVVSLVVAAVGLAGRARLAVGAVLASACVGLGCGAAAIGLHVAALHRGPVASLARTDRTVELALRLVRDPAQVRSSTGRPLIVTDATASAVRVLDGAWRSANAPVTLFAVTGPWLGLLPGQHLTVTARLRPPRPGDLVSAVGFAVSAPRLVGVPPFWQRWAGRVRGALRTACVGLDADERGLVPGLVLGDVAAMPPDLTDAFRATGLTHLNAVSGANVAIVVGAVLAIARRAGLRRRWRVGAAVAVLPAFVILVRPSPSVLRAAVMGAVVLIASFVGRRSASLPILSASVLLLMLVDPFLARSPGFAMSVLATAAIVVVAPTWTQRLSRHVPRPVAAAIAVPAAAQLACTPVLVAAFGQLTPLAIPANLLAAPAVAPATLAGICCALVAVVAPSVAVVPAHLAGLAAEWLAIVARTLSSLPGAGLHGPSGPPGVALVGAGSAVAWLLARTLRRRRSREMLDACPP
jgi:competence protein ComEC